MSKWTSYITSSILKLVRAVTDPAGKIRSHVWMPLRWMSMTNYLDAAGFFESVFLRHRLGSTLHEQKHAHAEQPVTTEAICSLPCVWFLLFFSLNWFSNAASRSHHKHVCGVRKTGHAPQSQPTCENSHSFTHWATHSFIHSFITASKEGMEAKPWLYDRFARIKTTHFIQINCNLIIFSCTSCIQTSASYLPVNWDWA